MFFVLQRVSQENYIKLTVPNSGEQQIFSDKYALSENGFSKIKINGRKRKENELLQINYVWNTVYNFKRNLFSINITALNSIIQSNIFSWDNIYFFVILIILIILIYIFDLDKQTLATIL